MNIKKKKVSLRNLVISLIMLLLLTVTLSMGGITLAWFYKGADRVPTDTLRGSIHAAYFNGGIGAEPAENATYKTENSMYPSYSVGGAGSRQGPYQIDNVTQLYNFAWLQYLGYFNDENGPYYFVLTDDIDASSIVLPPIGTREKPFVGYFDGNGCQITGLRISNDISDLRNSNAEDDKFNIPESAFTDGDLSDQAEIVGFFGVVGNMTANYASSSFVPTVKNVILSGTNIKTQTTSSLAGIAAGYVNGIMENVTVTGTSVINNSASSSLSFTDNLSDYALVGYCTEPYRKQLNVETVNVYEPIIKKGTNGRLGNSSQGQAWGNSIDMKSMYDRLDGIYNGIQSNGTSSYISQKTVVHCSGTTTVTSTATATVTVPVGSDYSFKTTKTLANGEEYASYALIEQNSTHNFVYLYGDKAIAAPIVTITDIYNEDAFYIQYNGNYLTAALGNTTAAGSAGKWVFETSSNGYKIYTLSGANKQYLYKNSQNALVVGSSGSEWTVTTDQNGTSISTDGYYLCFSNDAWKLLQPPKCYITDSTETYYLSVSGSSIVNANSANATPWIREEVNGGGYLLKADIENATYYLKADSEYTISLVNDSSTATIWHDTAGTANTKPKIYTDLGSGNGKALYYDGSVWKLADYSTSGTGNDWGGSIDFKELNKNVYNAFIGYNSKFKANNEYKFQKNDMYLAASLSGNYSKNPLTLSSSDKLVYRYRTNTYIPINMNGEAEANEGNTGYIVGLSGSNSNAGAVRSAAYPINYIYRSLGLSKTVSYDDSKIEILTKYNDSNDSWVRIKDTHNENNTTVNSDISSLTRKSVSDLGFEKYDKARKSLDDILKNSTHVHGIHIDTKAINANTKIVIPNAKILGQTKTSYNVPAACINFNLKEAGKINFIAGSYYNDVDTNADSFFSLHHVIRTSNTAFSIKEISKIYQNTGADSDTTPYVYMYTDNTYSKNTYGNDLIFDMSWLWSTPTEANALYYFEIPVNSGEYAMGAVTNNGTVKSQGAYLLYLDISANATIEGDSKFEEGEAVNPVVTSSAGTVSYSTVTTETVTVKTPPTYFPLALNDDGTDVSDVNTGYIISGANSTAGSPPGDIRVSRYNKNYTSNWRGIGNSLTNGSLDDGKIRTWNLDNANSGWQTVSQYGAVKLQKYLTSKEELQKVLDADANNYVYGLHFMDAQISTSNLVTVPNATINGHTYTDYQMPKDSIDFNLKTSGYINVFAGTYFSIANSSGPNVDCFFSLYKIERDQLNHQIIAINEIKAIYEDNGSYSYQYKDGTAPSGTKVFDTDCLTKPSGLVSDSVYYFEIPVGAGEFAIGSVNGMNGGYLLYLDISTHQGDSVEVHEKMTIDTATYILPIGVEFEGTANTVFEVPVNKTGNITFTDTINNGTGTVTATHSLTATVSNSGKIIQTVTITDSSGSFSSKKITQGSNVNYYYREGNDEYSEVTVPADISKVEKYFDGTPVTSILTYGYSVEGSNSVNNRSGGAGYLSDTGFTITSYPITAEANDEAVTATIQHVDNNASYLEFNGEPFLSLSQNNTIQIPTAGP